MAKMAKPIRTLIRHYPVFLYGLVALAITWGLKYAYALASPQPGMIPFNYSLFASWGPSLAALLLISLSEGKPGLLRLCKRLLDWRINSNWLFFAIFFEPALFLSASCLPFW